MKPQTLITSYILSTSALILRTEAAPQFNLTAISTAHNESRLECWSLNVAPKFGRGAVNFGIGSIDDAFIGILPPRTYSNSTISHAPTVQFTMVLSGLIHIRIPNSTLSQEKSEAWIHGGRYGIIIAADTAEKSKSGHIAEFPSADETVLAEFPVAGDSIPEHSLLYTGPCKMADLIGV
ncbi:hypothetical protein K432DRAFT_319778 [Lepidopterella palustris CBS 459.81]|uniref:Small secreted protein n=1 Tax=Lepidopterella palustris CBS 459.81 TaxID=1314670 RepID=A0A8E2JJK4_9PEZI|nr:hypothetical protein K432DRAFT_319778 [Lepidopterella palustris CBS 459.81]